MRSLGNGAVRTWWSTTCTLTATLLMGYANSFSFIFNDGAFVSPQTGNFIRMGATIGRGFGVISSSDITLLVGFVAGCIIGGLVASKNASGHPLRGVTSWSAVTGGVLLLALGAETVSNATSVLILSMLSGLCLSLLRKVADVDVNNCIMTGNTKNIFANAVKGVKGGDCLALRKAMVYLGVVLLFFIGAVLAGMVSIFGKETSLVVALAICAIPYIAFGFERLSVGQSDARKRRSVG